MYGYIYMWINKINNHKYIGKHKYDKLEWDQNYVTSGGLIQKKMKEYGIENFERVMLDVCDSLEELNEAERYWIAEFETYIEWNKGGYNLTLGGDGGGDFCEETREKISANTKAALANPKIRKKMSEAAKIANMDPEIRKKRSESGKIAQNRPEVKKRNSEAQKEIWKSQEARDKQSKIQKLAQNRPEVKKRNSEAQKIAQNRPEVKKKRSETLKVVHAKPEIKKKYSDAQKIAQNRPEVKNKQREAQKGRKWINNGKYTKKVIKEEIDSYLSNGWQLGRLKTI